MPILFSVVARDDQILAKHAVCAGNFIQVTQQVLTKIPPRDDKLTYSHGAFLLHYVRESGITYMAITDEAFERSKVFQFLNVVKKRFQQIYGQRALTAIPYAMNNDFAPVLASEMKAATLQRTGSASSIGPGPSKESMASESQVSGSSSLAPSNASSKQQQVQAQVEDLKKIMVKNIDTLANRGEKLELLIDRSQNLEHGSVNFRTHSHNLQQQMYRKNIKMTLIICAAVAVIVFIIILLATSGNSG